MYIRRMVYYLVGILYLIFRIPVRLHGAIIGRNTVRFSPALVPRFVFGRFERDEWQMATPYIENADALVDLGAGTGALSTALRLRMKTQTSHIALEANPQLIPLITETTQLNRPNTTVVHGAIDYAQSETAQLHYGNSFLQSSTHNDGRHFSSYDVPATSLRTLIDTCELRDARNGLLLIDIEGAEVDLLTYDLDVLRNHFAVAVIEFHPTISGGPDIFSWADEQLHSIGFRKDRQAGDSVAYIRSQ